MATFPNAGYNNPALGQAFGDIASLFAPPSPQEQLVAQTLKGQQATAAAKAAALGRLTPDMQDAYNLENGDPTAISKLYQLKVANTPGATLADQDKYAYAGSQQAGNTYSGRQATSTLSSDQKQVIPAGVFSPNAITLTNPAPDKPDASPSVDQVIAKAVQDANANPNDAGAQQRLKTAIAARGGGGGVSVTNVNGGSKTLENNLADQLSTGSKQAQAAVMTLPNYDRQEAAINTGMFTGTGADLKSQIVGALASTLGMPSPDLEHTQEFLAAAQNNVGARAKSLATSGHTTNMDIDVSKLAEGGDINYTAKALKTIIQQNRQLALDQINQHNAFVDKYSKQFPDQAGMASIYHVDVPQSAYPASTSLTPANAPQPDAANGGGSATPGPAAAPASPYGGAPQPITPLNVNAPRAPAGSPPAITTAIPPAAAAYLKANPAMRPMFEAKYGPGTAASVLGQ